MASLVRPGLHRSPKLPVIILVFINLVTALAVSFVALRSVGQQNEIAALREAQAAGEVQRQELQRQVDLLSAALMELGVDPARILAQPSGSATPTDVGTDTTSVVVVPPQSSPATPAPTPTAAPQQAPTQSQSEPSKASPAPSTPEPTSRPVVEPLCPILGPLSLPC